MGNLVDRLERENATETFNVVITPTMESLYMVYLQTVGVISSLLSVVLIFLIIFRSPSHTFALVVLLETLAMFFICLLQRFVVLTGHIRHQIALNTLTPNK
ncbi:hypothetical protein PMAYCL1PPCAC_14783 [Pristionchus mayeri]|uniref:G protein-coupled receptor n=1 Tax=Pristionchus mayeri TaxID=1317129 RepID=A0AAN5CHP5_9BILA|nr:hypothetical protein PMAYCL1PPCAC_14783 [Pristionchus mayeri]